jgi:divalent metal cation (Fe/Co/Zn/Cd) transporter
MVLEGVIAIFSGIVAHSVALEAFGSDSWLELVSAGIVLWWLRLTLERSDSERTHRAGDVARSIVGGGLLLLTIYVVAGASYQLVRHSAPEASVPGLVLAVAATVVMPVLYELKRRNGERLPSAAVRGDAYQSLSCGWIALTLLVGLALHRYFGWWWADPVAALFLVPLLVREGWEGLGEWIRRSDDGADARQEA